MRRVEGREPLFYETNIQDSAVSQVQAFSVAPLLGPHWPTSRINPLTTSQQQNKTIETMLSYSYTLIIRMINYKVHENRVTDFLSRLWKLALY